MAGFAPSQERLDELVARPIEGLNVEIKSWFDTDAPSGVAKIARAALALRNRNGGFIIVGFDDKTLQPVDQPATVVLESAFHLDRIQEIVSRYAAEKFEIAVGFGNRDSRRYPVITVPSGVRSPVAARADLDESGKKLVRAGEVYFRTLQANHRPSTAPAKADDWREIAEICFENREADIGRFLRRLLSDRDLTTLVQTISSLKETTAAPENAIVKAKANSLALLTSGEARFKEAIQEKAISKEDQAAFSHGTWEVAVVIEPPKHEAPATQQFLSTLSSSNPQYTGWPTWLDTRGFSDGTQRPYIKDDAWQYIVIAVGGFGGGHAEFARMEPTGALYLLRALQDDLTPKINPGTSFDPVLSILRVAEAIAVGLAYAKALGFDEISTQLAFTFQWKGLKGRRLHTWANPMVMMLPSEPANQDTVWTTISVPLSTPPSAIAPAVDDATKFLFAAFDGQTIPLPVIEDWVKRLVERRL